MFCLFYPGGSPRPTPSPFTQQLSQFRPSSILPPPHLQILRCPYYKATVLILHSPAHNPLLALRHLWSQAHTARSTPDRSAPGPWLPLQASPTLGKSPFPTSWTQIPRAFVFMLLLLQMHFGLSIPQPWSHSPSSLFDSASIHPSRITPMSSCKPLPQCPQM